MAELSIVEAVNDVQEFIGQESPVQFFTQHHALGGDAEPVRENPGGLQRTIGGTREDLVGSPEHGSHALRHHLRFALAPLLQAAMKVRAFGPPVHSGGMTNQNESFHGGPFGQALTAAGRDCEARTSQR